MVTVTLPPGEKNTSSFAASADKKRGGDDLNFVPVEKPGTLAPTSKR